jgi:ribosomal protein S12
MFKDEELKSLIVINNKTKEVIAMITKEGEIVAENNIVVVEDYTDDDKEIIEEKYGKFYYKGVE